MAHEKPATLTGVASSAGLGAEVNEMEPNCDRESCGDFPPGECDHPACPSRLEYIPRIGHAVVARRKAESKIYKNLIVGPVVDVWDNACRILNNPGTEVEGDFRLYFSEWEFEYLHDA